MPLSTHPIRVLILCTANSCRSQMAEGLAMTMFPDSHKVYSAGTYPNSVNPNVITVLKEINIDISHFRSKSLTEFINTPFDYILTVCADAENNCPFFPGPAHRIHWGFDDPAKIITPKYGDELDPFRTLRNDIIQKFQSEWVSTFIRRSA